MELSATAGVIAAAAGIGIGNLISRDGRGIDAPNQLRSLRIRHSSEIAILGALAGLELQGLIFRRQGRDLILRQEVQNRAGIGVCVVDNIPCAVLDGIAGIACLCGHVVIYAVNRALGITAALGNLRTQRIETSLGLIAQITHRLIHPVETIGHSISNGGLTILEAVQGKPLIDVGARGIALEAGTVHTISAAKAAAEAAIAAPTVKETEDEEKHNPRGPIASPAAKAAVSALIGGSNRHRHNSAVRRKTHDNSPLIRISKPWPRILIKWLLSKHGAHPIEHALHLLCLLLGLIVLFLGDFPGLHHLADDRIGVFPLHLLHEGLKLLHHVWALIAHYTEKRVHSVSSFTVFLAGFVGAVSRMLKASTRAERASNSCLVAYSTTGPFRISAGPLVRSTRS